MKCQHQCYEKFVTISKSQTQIQFFAFFYNVDVVLPLQLYSWLHHLLRGCSPKRTIRVEHLAELSSEKHIALKLFGRTNKKLYIFAFGIAVNLALYSSGVKVIRMKLCSPVHFWVDHDCYRINHFAPKKPSVHIKIISKSNNRSYHKMV